MLKTFIMHHEQIPTVPKCTAMPVEHIGSKLIVYSLKGSRQNSSQSFAAYKLGVSSIVPNGLLPQTVSQWYISPHGLQYICTSKYVLLCTYVWLHTAEQKILQAVVYYVLCFGLGLRGRKRLTYSQWGQILLNSYREHKVIIISRANYRMGIGSLYA